MEKYDVIVIGASTTGAWFSGKMAEKGFKVLAVEKASREKVSDNYTVFHLWKSEMKRFSLPIPDKADRDYAFEFTGGAAYSAYGNYPKKSYTEVVGLFKHEYTLRLIENAESKGAEFRFCSSFTDFIFNEKGQIIGIKYSEGNEIKEAYGSVTADCSGVVSAGRRRLPDGYGVESFEITKRDMMYVVLNYVHYNEHHEKVKHTDSFLQYKAWSAPSDDEHGGILGVGANYSFEYAEEMFKQFSKNVPLPPYELIKTEKAVTPYHRPPYSFVADGFVCMGDSACLNKPNNGEGCTSCLYQAEIAVEVISKCLKNGEYPTREKMWSINTRYNDVQGKSFASTRAILIGTACIEPKETEFFFKHDIIFTEKSFSGITSGVRFSPVELAKIGYNIVKGVSLGTVRVGFLCHVGIGALKSKRIKAHYDNYPKTPVGFDEWAKKADILWERVGSMADNCDTEIIKRLEDREKALSV